MPTQQSFDGFESPPDPTDRLFFAVLPDAATARRVMLLTQELRRDHGLRGNSINLQKLHISLLHLGDYVGLPRDMIAVAQHVAAMIGAASFTARLDHIGSFAGKPGRQPLVLRGGEGMAGFAELYAALLTPLQIGRRMASLVRNFTPHMTVLYGSRLADMDIEPIEWQVSEFVLLRSLINKGLPYEVLDRWTLQSAI